MFFKIVQLSTSTNLISKKIFINYTQKKVVQLTIMQLLKEFKLKNILND
jgi:hypothetical protein